MAVGQVQAGWLQHDFGHLSVFDETVKDKLWNTNKFWHYLTISFMKGASSSWWRFRHNQHHAKPNIIGKDPDLKNEPLFIFGSKMSLLGHGSIITPYQSFYWWFLGPPMVTSVYFLITNYYYVWKWKLVVDFIWAHCYLLRTWIIYSFVTGSWVSMLKLYFFMRAIESTWFTWVTAMNHFPMNIDIDKEGMSRK